MIDFLEVEDDEDLKGLVLLYNYDITKFHFKFMTSFLG